jgi:TolA-binding protein
MRADGLNGFAVMVDRQAAHNVSCGADQRRVTDDTHGGQNRMPKPQKTDTRFDADKALEDASREIDSQKSRADELAKKLDQETKRADELAGKVTGLEQQLTEARTQVDGLERVDELEAQVTELTEERDALKVKLDEALDPEKRADAVKERVALLETARGILGEVANMDEMSDRDVMTLVIEKRGGKVDEKHSDEHVRGAFDGHVAGFVRGSRSLARLRAAATVLTEDGAPAVKKTARDEYIERQRNGWKQGGNAQKGA